MRFVSKTGALVPAGPLFAHFTGVRLNNALAMSLLQGTGRRHKGSFRRRRSPERHPIRGRRLRSFSRKPIIGQYRSLLKPLGR